MVCLGFAQQHVLQLNKSSPGICSGSSATHKAHDGQALPLPEQPDLTAPAFYRGSPLKKCIVVKHLGREELAVDGTCSKSPPLKRLCQDVQVCSWRV